MSLVLTSSSLTHSPTDAPVSWSVIKEPMESGALLSESFQTDAFSFVTLSQGMGLRSTK